MTFIVSLIVAILFGLWGYKKGLFAVWAFAFNTILAVYLGVMLTPMILDMAGEYLAPLGTYVNVTVMFAITLIYFIIAQFISFIYFTKTFCVSLPKYVDIIGGAILAFVGGLLITNFILFTIAVSPIRDISYISKFIPAKMEISSRQHILNACEFVSTCSLQYGDKNIATAIEVVSRSGYSKPITPVVPTETKPNKPKLNEPNHIMAAPKQPQKTIPELNE